MIKFQGLNDGLIGPTLSDLQLILHSTAEQVSIVFTWRALLAVAGSLASSRLQVTVVSVVDPGISKQTIMISNTKFNVT